MKKYIGPKVKVVTLDPDQAILEVCQIGGGYFVFFGQNCASPGTGGICIRSIRGNANGCRTGSEPNAQPS